MRNFRMLALGLCLGVSAVLIVASSSVYTTYGTGNGTAQAFVQLCPNSDGTQNAIPCSSVSIGNVTQGAGSASNPWWMQGLGTAGTPSGGVLSIQSVSPQLVSPAAATANAITTGGTAVTFVTGPVNGGYICNPLSASDQNIATAEVGYVNPVTTATANGRGTNSALQPGQCYTVPALKTGSNISAIAATSSHAFNVVVW